ncbi:MAG: phosphotransferase family protein [Hyphomicrobiales bacterium]|nr:phosphotransferase family protein [Hyphomicrobiales bacterium]MCP5371594.1 phosphotransferase family protein [Hyphomicrobiales bacterium]
MGQGGKDRGEDWRGPLAAWLTARAGAEVRVAALAKLAGGAVQENWALDAEVDGAARRWVLRTDPPTRVDASHGRAEEFALLRAAHGAGVTVPEPLWLCPDAGASPIGKAFFVMARVDGVAAGFRLVRDDTLGGDRTRLLERLGGELARIHAIVPPRDDLAFLPPPAADPALAAVAEYRALLDTFDTPHPALEWGLRWLQRHAPAPGERVLTHRDFRTGNFMVDGHGLTGILDWEFAAWGDPMEDLGWFCARCWRFGADGKEAGGIGDRAPFYAGYTARSGRAVDPDLVRYWEVMAHARWAAIAVQQGERFFKGGERNLEAALTGHVVPELEYEILTMVDD